MYLVNTDNISYLDADGNYITLHTTHERHTIYDSLTNLESKLDPTDFVRIHRSHIVNINFIAEVETYFNGEYIVRLKNGQQLKWTRNYRENMKAFYAKSI